MTEFVLKVDQSEFNELMRRADEQAARAKRAPMSGADFDAMMKRADAAQAKATDPTALDQQGRRPDGTLYSSEPRPEPGLGNPTSTLDAFSGGAIKGLIFEPKDFLFGDTAPADRSSFRRSVETTVEAAAAVSMIDGFSAGIGQFAGAMVGLGKFTAGAKALPWFGKGVAAVAEYAPKTVETLKAAAAGAIGFDPHEERLSNLVQTTPMANPVNDWLAADPTDTAAEGRLKAAMESIGLDAAILGTFIGAGRIWKALRNGDAEAASRAVDQMEAERAKHIADSEAGGGLDDSAEAVQAPQGSGAPEAAGSPGAHVQPAVSPGAGIAETPDVAAEAGITLPPSPLPGVRLSDEDTEAVLKSMTDDADAMAKHGGWAEAVEAGHVFGRGEKVPYAKLNNEQDVAHFMARVVDTAEERLDNVKGGAVLSDAKLDRVVSQMATMFDADPATLLGMVQKAGADAANAVANMEAGYLVSNRLMQDSYALAARIRLGDYSAFGNRAAALAELQKRMSLAASIYGAARSITAAGGRSVRRMRMEFKVDPATVAKLDSVTADRLVQIITETRGDPRALARIVGEPGLWEKTKDFLQFLYVNNLVSGWKTQAFNIMSSGYMIGVRPLERMIGAVVSGQGTGSVAFRQSLKQYSYLGAAFTDGFQVAAKAFLLNDSILAPHRTEVFKAGQPVAASLGQLKPWTTPANLLHNALSVAALPVGLPTRTLGAVDELVKQTVYRSKVLAAAHLEVTEEGVLSGLTGRTLKAHVRQGVEARLLAAFDEQGRATDPAALREAQIATFQNELAPGSIGKLLQSGVQQVPMLRFIMPFVKTPTNVIRYGWKLTPGLNILQAEFREMLIGKRGAEARAQATGQMMMGGLFMGSAAFLVSQGTITGGGPKDYKALDALRATGWQPYSVVVEHDDGSKTYLPFNRLDPVAIPFGIIADLMDALHVNEGEDGPEISAAIGATLMATARAFTSKTYLIGVQQFLDFATEAADKDGGGLSPAGERYVGQIAANFVPYSAALRQLNPDPLMREAREIGDRVLAILPGFSETLPAKYDAWGDPMHVRTGLWSSAEDQAVDVEVQRLILEGGGSAIGRPAPVNNGVDLREVTMTDGKNAYEVYQQLAGHFPGIKPLKVVIAKRMASARYKLAPDGPMDVRGTKLWLLHPVVSKYRSAALRRLRRDPLVRDALRAEEQKAKDQYRANKAASKPSPMKKLGDSFGVDLDKL